MKKNAAILLIGIAMISVIGGILFTQNDPIEEAKMKHDEKLQREAAEFIQATVLYFAAHEALPWFSEEEKGANCFNNQNSMFSVPMDLIEHCMSVLIAENVLRNDYQETVDLDSLRITNPNPQTTNKLDTVVCFQPQSKMWQQDVQTRYTIDGQHAPAGHCSSQGGSEFCYWCTQ